MGLQVTLGKLLALAVATAYVVRFGEELDLRPDGGLGGHPAPRTHRVPEVSRGHNRMGQSGAS